MRRILAAAALTAALAGLLPAAPVPAAGSATPLVVTPAWLAERLNDPSLVVLQVAAVRDDYARGHIPGARFVWLNWLAESSPERSFEMPPVKALEDRLEQLGVSNGSQVVICHTLGDPTAAARVYLTLDYLGMGERAVILDGGLEAWKREGRTLTQEVPKHKRGKFTPSSARRSWRASTPSRPSAGTPACGSWTRAAPRPSTRPRASPWSAAGICPGRSTCRWRR